MPASDNEYRGPPPPDREDPQSTRLLSIVAWYPEPFREKHDAGSAHCVVQRVVDDVVVVVILVVDALAMYRETTLSVDTHRRYNTQDTILHPFLPFSPAGIVD